MHDPSPSPPKVIGHCWHCGAGLTVADYGRENLCLACGKPTRCCRNCRNYQPGRPHDCLEPVAEPVGAKDRANFCEFFEPGANTSQEGKDATADDLRRVAEGLFIPR